MEYIKHSEYIFEKENCKTAILFIHGIIEGPNQFNDFINSLNGSYSIYNILLPGHGKKIEDFANASMNQWKSCVKQKIIELQKIYDNIIIVGHSMGTLLAINCAINYPSKVKGLFLLALPLTLHLKPNSFTNALKVAFNKVKENDFMAVACKQSYSINGGNPLNYIRWLPRYTELYFLALSVRKDISKLTIPIEVYQSKNDEFVGRNSMKYFNKLQNVKVYEFLHSGHFYYIPSEREKLIKKFDYFLKTLGV